MSLLRRSSLRSKASILSALTVLAGVALAGVAHANPAITPSTILLVKTCPGPAWNEPCEWMGGPGGEITGQITIDDALGIDIKKIETRPVGAVAWTEELGFGADPMDGVKAQRTGNISWTDPFGLNLVVVPCAFFDERLVDVRVTTEYTDPFGKVTKVEWVIQVTFRMVCEECTDGDLETDSSGNQSQPTRGYDHSLRNTFSLVNRSAIPRTLDLVVTSEQPWALDLPFASPLELLPGELVLLPVDVIVPVGTLDGTTSALTLLATDVNDPLVNVATSLDVIVDETAAALQLVPLSPLVSLLLLGGTLTGTGAAIARRRKR